MRTFHILSLLCIAIATVAGCQYDYLEPVLVFVNNKAYDIDKIPFVLGNLQVMEEGTGISAAELEALRQRTVQWLKVGFGFPNTDVYNATSQTTSFPGIGDIVPVFFNDSYELVSSNDPSFGPNRCYYLAAVEMVWMRNVGGTVPFNYGGKYGQLMDATGGSKAAKPGDGVSFGYYYIMRPLLNGRFHRVEKRIAYKSILINSADQPFRSHQEMILKDAEWGNGMTTLEIQASVNQNGKYVSQIINNMKFNDPYNVFVSNGIHIDVSDLIVP